LAPAAGVGESLGAQSPADFGVNAVGGRRH
jgi:hypothetical protein